MNTIVRVLLWCFLVVLPAQGMAQEADMGIFCDTQDQITAVVEYDNEEEAVNIINATFPNACSKVAALFHRGKVQATVRGGNFLYDITPVRVVGIGENVGRLIPVAQGMTQWTAFRSLSVEASYKVWLVHDDKTLSPEMQAWAQQVEITPEGRKRLPWAKCCNHAEIVDSKFIVEPDGSDGWRWNDYGVMKKIPPDIIHPHGDHAPNGRATLFVYSGTMTCFFIPDGGI